MWGAEREKCAKKLKFSYPTQWASRSTSHAIVSMWGAVDQVLKFPCRNTLSLIVNKTWWVSKPWLVLQ